ncbi:MAG: HNH endonuclease [Bacteroidota bacterium]
MVNFVKSQPPPASLAIEKQKPSGRYNLEDVLIKLREDFFNKCYLCEEKFITSINVEHFIPHLGRNLDLKFDWNNLFWACSHCNLTKNTYDQEMLNCTNPEHDVLYWISYRLGAFPKEELMLEIEFESDEETDFDISIVENTVELLKRCYNGTTLHKKMEASNLRQKVLLEIQAFEEKLIDYLFGGYDEEEEKEYLKRKIKEHLSVKSSFTAFKKWIVLDNALHKETFKSLFD